MKKYINYISYIIESNKLLKNKIIETDKIDELKNIININYDYNIITKDSEHIVIVMDLKDLESFFGLSDTTLYDYIQFNSHYPPTTDIPLNIIKTYFNDKLMKKYNDIIKYLEITDATDDLNYILYKIPTLEKLIDFIGYSIGDIISNLKQSIAFNIDIPFTLSFEEPDCEIDILLNKLTNEKTISEYLKKYQSEIEKTKKIVAVDDDSDLKIDDDDIENNLDQILIKLKSGILKEIIIESTEVSIFETMGGKFLELLKDKEWQEYVLFPELSDDLFNKLEKYMDSDLIKKFQREKLKNKYKI